MAPPLPPCLVDMRLAASRQHSITPIALIAKSFSSSAASYSSTRVRRPVPALLTRWVIGPSARSVSSNSRTISASRAMSPGRATAVPPAAAMSATTALAAASRER